MKRFPLLLIVCITGLVTPFTSDSADWPVLKEYDADHLAKIALPLGGIGTGTVSLGGRGNLFDWELMNHPAKGFTPSGSEISPFFALYAKPLNGQPVARALEGPLDESLFENSHGSIAANHGLPRFRHARFSAAYPLGQLHLSDPDVPLHVRLEAWNPMIPTDPDRSGLPIAILRYVLINPTDSPIAATLCGTIPNFIGMDGWNHTLDWKGDPVFSGSQKNRNHFRQSENIQGIYMESEGVEPHLPAWGTFALTTTAREILTYRTAWTENRWGSSLLDFWDDFTDDGRLENRKDESDTPLASLAVSLDIPAQQERSITFLLTWHFPNRYAWLQRTHEVKKENFIGNYYTQKYNNAWHAAEQIAPLIEELERDTAAFVGAFCQSDLPLEVKEAALFNASTLRTETCFRTPDGRFFGWEGSCNSSGCCFGSCTHVWNYEQATPFLYGSLAMSMREVEFAHATHNTGLMCFRVQLPIDRATHWANAAADGQMGCIMKMYRDWQLSGDDNTLKSLWPNVKRSLEFCWIQGGWDADKDGVMEGCQHNTMDVEYFGPNPQMGIWYLGALRAAEEMAAYLGDKAFAKTCKTLFENGSQWIDAHLFNGEYYIHQVVPQAQEQIAKNLIVGMGAKDFSNPEFQLAEGCLVDQLVGQFMAHVCGLGYLTQPAHVRKTLESIMKYNSCEPMIAHFNNMRSFAMGDEAALLMASYPNGRPKNPFSYFNEVMTGFEYTAAVGMLFEGQDHAGLQCIRNVRERYDGKKRSPFDEAECGHHYARAMASWAAVLALTEFQYSAVERSLTLTASEGAYFWSTGYAYGTATVSTEGKDKKLRIEPLKGEITVRHLTLNHFGSKRLRSASRITSGNPMEFLIQKSTVKK